MEQPPITFQFQFAKDDLYIVEKYQDVHIRSVLGEEFRQEKNRIVLKIIEKKADFVLMSGNFYTYQRFPGKSEQFIFQSEYQSEFRFYYNGRYEISKNRLMPNVRSIPTIPLGNLPSVWQSPAEQILHVGRFLFPLHHSVVYRYKGMAKLPDEAYLLLPQEGKGQLLPQIDFSYQIDKAMENPVSPVRRIQASSESSLWLNQKAGIPSYDVTTSRYFLFLRERGQIEYNYKIYSWYFKVPSLKRNLDTIIDNARKKIPVSPDINVKKHKNGVQISLGAVMFPHDSAILKEEAKKALEKIAEYFKGYPDREIRIFGHTDNVGGSAYNQALSEKRALSVMEAFMKNGIPKRRLSYKGFGASQPKVSNQTLEGRKQNRRVEILMITE